MGRSGLVMLRGRNAVADRVIGEAFGEASYFGAVEDAPGGHNLVPAVVPVGIDRSGKRAHCLASLADRNAPSGGVVPVRERGDGTIAEPVGDGCNEIARLFIPKITYEIRNHVLHLQKE